MIRTTLFALVLLIPTNALAQHAHKNSNTPTETGQSTFATIAEIVESLNNDPKTDWSKININDLRSHLLDMDRVTMDASVEVNSKATEVEFKITATGEAIGSIQRMVSAHSDMLSAKTGWGVQSIPISDGMIMSITVNQTKELSQVEALGFFGIMTIGAHHQEHHLQIATGGNPHH